MNFLNRQWKENIAYLLGAAGFIHQIVIVDVAQPFILTASLALMGFPLVYKADEKLKAGAQADDSEKK